MRKTSIAIALLLLATPAIAAEVGPYQVDTRLTDRGSSMAFDASVSGGDACEQLAITVRLADGSSDQEAKVSDTLERYKPNFRGRVQADIKVDTGAGISKWYVSDIVLRCVNKGEARQYRLNN